jgi:uncharacterized membrane protein
MNALGLAAIVPMLLLVAMLRVTLFYVNHGDPAILVGKRFGVGWTLNFGNVRAWLLVGGMVLVAVAVTATTLGP